MVVEVLEVKEMKHKEYIKWELDQEQNPKEHPFKTGICQASKLIISRVGTRTQISQYLSKKSYYTLNLSSLSTANHGMSLQTFTATHIPTYISSPLPSRFYKSKHSAIFGLNLFMKLIIIYNIKVPLLLQEWTLTSQCAFVASMFSYFTTEAFTYNIKKS